ncbi:integrase [Sphingobium sp. B1D7B]|uniref:tyrosine-type recombinase/integrase n=1 Tax=Sphingobium sp. B1D7B TaxID=2940578 RepID=UPI002225438E|nr:site-specific integrase [Sphingobium sp. B1D7B]MCW2404429.1 integrase [Sphingobium sp. B1D7B]
MGKLTAIQVKNLTEPGKYADGDGLMLQIGKTGGRSWILRIQTNGKRQDIGLGKAELVSLREAREKAMELRKVARSGVSPLEEKRRVTVVIPTFREASRLVHAEQCKAWKNGKHTDQWLTTLEKYAWPKLGDLKVDAIDGPLIRDVLAEIWLDIPETARRVKQRIGAVLDWSYVKGYRATEAPMRSLARGLPRQPKKDGHFEALPYEQVPMFVLSLRERKLSISRLALELLLFTAARSGEVRGARWSELNADRSVWIIPAERMKAGKAHSIPLSTAAQAVLREAESFRVDYCDLIFPGQGRRSVERTVDSNTRFLMSDMTLLQLVRGMDLNVTVHGFRSSFRDWCADQTDYPREVAEAALAHTLENKVEAAYRRTDFFEKRRALMDDWASYCDSAA